jgi:acetolactate synthase-1/2/3 large subunit
MLPRLHELGVPIATTWNAADRIAADDPLYFGRPNTWGMRYANILLQQSDFILALGTRLGMQQTGFNWKQFGPIARIVQVDVDDAELRKGHPRIDLGVCGDAAVFLELLIEELAKKASDDGADKSWSDWLAFGEKVRNALPLADPLNVHAPNFIDPFEFALELSSSCSDSDVIVPCSSGGAFTTMMQAFQQRAGQVIVTNKGLASMGYGLSGAIGAALARPQSRTVLVEGDGGFAQNLQEVGTVAAQGLNLKMFILSNEGYASIRMTQRNYFDGAYMGCDIRTGLGLPDWETLFEAFGVPVVVLDPKTLFAGRVRELFDQEGPAAFVVPVDPDQTYYPKITSRITESGTMESAPLHVMYPELDGVLMNNVMPYLTRGSQE